MTAITKDFVSDHVTFSDPNESARDSTTMKKIRNHEKWIRISMPRIRATRIEPATLRAYAAGRSPFQAQRPAPRILIRATNRRKVGGQRKSGEAWHAQTRHRSQHSRSYARGNGRNRGRRPAGGEHLYRCPQLR